jgi:diguanylate cyclase (GGDEF)-like protein/PAS domain S-box-containing protein
MAEAEAMDFRFLTENSADVICRVGTDRVVTYISPSCRTLLGRGRDEIEGGTMDHLTHAEDLPKVLAAIEHSFVSGVETNSETLRMIRKNGNLVWTEVNACIIREDATGEVREFVLTMRDITKRKLLEDRLSALAMTDGLTGLANRRAFDEALEREWKRTLREGSQMSLLLLDIDHFKRLNDRHGHQLGDDCLRALGAATVGAVRATDLVARYGGEEIAVILPVAGMVGAAETAEKVRAAVEGLRLSNEDNREGGGWLTVSIGVATALARHGGTMRMPAGLLQAADNALYRAKHAGRNRVEAGMLIVPQELQTA